MKKILKYVAVAVVALIVILVALPLFINVNSFRPKIQSELSDALGRKVEIGDLSLSILRGRLSVANISIADDPAFSKSPFLTAKSLKIGIELMPLIFSKQLNITGITLDEPSIAVLSAPNGTWNFSSIGGKSSQPAPAGGGTPSGSLSIAELKVDNGKLVVGKANSSAKPITIENVNIGVKNFSTTTQFPFTLSADLPGSGQLKLKGNAGPMAPAGIPVQATLEIEKLDLAKLGVDPSVGLAGLGNIKGAVDSDGKNAKVNGTVTLNKMKMSPKGSPASRAVEAKFATNYDLNQQAGAISQGDVSVGKAVARLTGGYQTQGDSTVLNMKLNAPGMPVEDLEALLPALGVALPAGSGLKGGTLSAALDITGPVDKLVIAGPVKLENSTLAGFDLGSKLSALSAFMGKAASGKDTIIQNASTDARVAPEGTKLDSINLTVPSLGVLTGAGTVSPEGALNFKMLANLSGGAAGGLATIAGRGGNGSESIPFSIEGTTANPKFVPDVKGIAGSAAKQALTKELGTQGQSEIKGLGGLFKKKPK